MIFEGDVYVGFFCGFEDGFVGLFFDGLVGFFEVYLGVFGFLCLSFGGG